MTKKYEIVISYETGNSFGRSDEEGTLELTWEFLGMAKENLKRIREHYEWYKSRHRSSYMRKQEEDVPMPEWLPKDWKYDHSILLKTDDGTECQIGAYWCGYFETLYGAEIKLVKDDEMSFDTFEY